MINGCTVQDQLVVYLFVILFLNFFSSSLSPVTLTLTLPCRSHPHPHSPSLIFTLNLTLTLPHSSSLLPSPSLSCSHLSSLTPTPTPPLTLPTPSSSLSPSLPPLHLPSIPLQSLLNYEVDSDDEWEEEEQGESISSSEVSRHSSSACQPVHTCLYVEEALKDTDLVLCNWTVNAQRTKLWLIKKRTSLMPEIFFSSILPHLLTNHLFV